MGRSESPSAPSQHRRPASGRENARQVLARFGVKLARLFSARGELRARLAMLYIPFNGKDRPACHQ